MKLTVYGDFNCPFSRLASHRIDLLVERGIAEVEFRAVEHDPEIPLDGIALVGGERAETEEDLAKVRELLTPADGDFALRVPAFRPNTATMCASYASTPTAELRRQLFDAVWADGAATAALTEEGSRRQAEWQAVYDSWDNKIVPSVVLEDGYVSRGLGGLKRMADLLAG